MRLSIVVAVFALLATPKLASAHAGNNDPNVVHACIGNVSKIVRIVGVSGSCISAPPVLAEMPAHWAIQGLQGAPGINGTNGTNGTNGAPGVNGTNGTNGINGTSVTFVDYFSGNQHGCPNGGAIYAAGGVSAYVCNGKDGQDATAGGTRAAGPCFDNTNRYVDCGNGTVTDTVTGLIWLKQADCLPSMNYAAANQAAAGLKDGDCGGNLTDKSSPGDWRLPTKNEWLATIRQAAALGCGDSVPPPSLTNDAGTACLGAPSIGPISSFVGVGTDFVWASTADDEVDPGAAWAAHLGFGKVGEGRKNNSDFPVWPVRGGPR